MGTLTLNFFTMKQRAVPTVHETSFSTIAGLAAPYETAVPGDSVDIQATDAVTEVQDAKTEVTEVQYAVPMVLDANSVQDGVPDKTDEKLIEEEVVSPEYLWSSAKVLFWFSGFALTYFLLIITGSLYWFPDGAWKESDDGKSKEVKLWVQFFMQLSCLALWMASMWYVTDTQPFGDWPNCIASILQIALCIYDIK